ncbi:MAG: hypothetical protein QW818_00625 [Candidatus Aenigmatarchaeota archaeon]
MSHELLALDFDYVNRQGMKSSILVRGLAASCSSVAGKGQL